MSICCAKTVFRFRPAVLSVRHTLSGTSTRLYPDFCKAGPRGTTGRSSGFGHSSDDEGTLAPPAAPGQGATQPFVGGALDLGEADPSPATHVIWVSLKEGDSVVAGVSLVLYPGHMDCDCTSLKAGE